MILSAVDAKLRLEMGAEKNALKYPGTTQGQI